MSKKGGMWGTRGWGFRMKSSKKSADVHKAGPSPREIRRKVNGNDR